MAIKKTSNSSVSKKKVLVSKKKALTTKTKKKYSPGLKNKPRFSVALLLIIIFVLTGTGVYLIYNSFAATNTGPIFLNGSEVKSKGKAVKSSPSNLTAQRAMSSNKTNISYFNVSGKTYKEVQKSLTQKRGRSCGGLYWVGCTSVVFSNLFYTEIEIQNPKGGVPQNCSVSSAKMFVEVNVDLPKWVNRNDPKVKSEKAPNGLTLIKHWDNFAASVKTHELRHGYIAVKAVDRIKENMLKIKNVKCTSIEARAQNIYNEGINWYYKDWHPTFPPGYTF